MKATDSYVQKVKRKFLLKQLLFSFAGFFNEKISYSCAGLRLILVFK